ncbi:MAG: hypothetical protein ABJH06_07195 [Paraglaciecola sp.]|uniref:hypothetical protein n=1 Tax=Paraglaciecola sp. TaxID=1920173 RepID=UPI00329A2466
MRISHKNKFIWISKPKTGSTSYRKLLDPYSDVRSVHSGPFKHHITLKELKRTFEENDWVFEDYYKIVACRNPWSLILSLYTYSKTDINGVKFWENNHQYSPVELMSFSEWINLEKHHKWFKDKHTLEEYTDDLDGKNLANLIFAADQDSGVFFRGMMSQCNLALENNLLDRLNVTEKSQDLITEVRDCYKSVKIDNLMNSIFSNEIELFNYTNPYI